MEEYTFHVHTGSKGFYDFVFEADPEQPLGSAFKDLIDEANKHGEMRIETHQEGQDGSLQRREWQFFWTAKTGEEAIRLDPDLSFNEEGIPPGSMITVSILDDLGSMPEVYRQRLRQDRRDFLDFIGLNSGYIEMSGVHPFEIQIILHCIRGIERLDDKMQPMYCDEHKFRILIPKDYPNFPLKVVPCTSLYHPNASMVDKDVCIFHPWHPTCRDMFAFTIIQLTDLIQYRKVNLGGEHRRMNPQAARWYEWASKVHREWFPVRPTVILSRPRRGVVKLSR